jgi:hypothetical protein
MRHEFSHDDDELKLRPIIKTRKNQDAEVQDPVWNVSDTALLTIKSVESGIVTLTHTSDTSLGIYQIRLEGDADLGDGVEPISHAEEVEVVRGKAYSITFERVS